MACLKREFLDSLSYIDDDKEYFSSFLGYLISPIITGIKPSSTVNLYNGKRKHLDLWKLYGEEILRAYNLEHYTFREDMDEIMILVFDRSNLEEHIMISENKDFLCKYGYENQNLDTCLNCLSERINSREFPHESGIFLGIPLVDVQGYLNRSSCKFVGYWRVYEEENRSKSIFDLYEESREMYVRRISSLKNRFVQEKNILYGERA